MWLLIHAGNKVTPFSEKGPCLVLSYNPNQYWFINISNFSQMKITSWYLSLHKMHLRKSSVIGSCICWVATGFHVSLTTAIHPQSQIITHPSSLYNCLWVVSCQPHLALIPGMKHRHHTIQARPPEATVESYKTGLNLDLHPANERRRYFVTTSLIGWVQA